MRIQPEDVGIIHFVGIGGIGMSGIAEILCDLGYTVQGSDIKDSANVKRLRDKGIAVIIGHDADNLKTDNGLVDLIVISSAIKGKNAELDAARAYRIPVVRRAEMLGELMRLKKSIVIGGTHGKTTTTSMVGTILEHGGVDPTVVNGGIVNSYGTNVRLGQGEWMVVEADESDGTFTRLPSTIAVITNIDPEHMEEYGSFENVRKAYSRFVKQLPFYGYAVLCSDHPEVQALIPEFSDRRFYTYGFNAQADVRISNLRFEKGGCLFDLTFAGWIKGGDGQTLKDIFLPVPGQHNVSNAAAALTIGYEMGLDFAALKAGLSQFKGVHRRFSQAGIVDGITVIDDYAHHPVEIAAVLKAARESNQGTGGRIIAVMQPHRYSRLSELFEDFCKCFNDADTVFIADVYTAGEDPIEGADKDGLVQGLKEYGHRDAHALSHLDNLALEIKNSAKAGDTVICMGAGDITKWAHDLPQDLKTKTKKTA